jgi:hypothetical protein
LKAGVADGSKQVRLYMGVLACMEIHSEHFYLEGGDMTSHDILIGKTVYEQKNVNCLVI